MKKNTFISWFIASFLIIAQTVSAQMIQPVKWRFSHKIIENKEAVLIFTADIDKPWHLYSTNIEGDGPVPTSFAFNPSKDYELLGGIIEKSKAISGFDEAFKMTISYFEGQAVFEQRIKLNNDKTVIQGTLEYMACNDTQCIPPEEEDFSFTLNIPPSKPAVVKADFTVPEEIVLNDNLKAVDTLFISEEYSTPMISNPIQLERISYWGLFAEGFLFGFLALLMPCIFPMIPLTVSFFTKQSASKAKGIKKSLLYGLSIVVIYVVLGLSVTVIFGAGVLNELASNAIVNLIFFFMLMLFGASFLGAFEINLPSSWSTKADNYSNQGGFMGVFFMALVLALSSFSCTGPLIGSLLVEAANYGSYYGPVMGMLGFSSALAIPFTLFAIFPNFMQDLPKSGGWLNSVKVTLGFLELAFALKFLSNADLAYHWGILDREVFLVLWIILFALLGFYLLGKIKFSHDSAIDYISVPRLLFATVAISFALYMVPGLWGAPLKVISAFVPPMSTQDFSINGTSTNAMYNQTSTQPKKYGGLFHAPHGLNAFFDYDEGMEYARQSNKPVLLDFTGHSCVNCRKMEANVWSDPRVLRILQNDYVLISLYVDDKTELPKEEQYTSSFSGKKVNTVGKKWSDFQSSVFHTNAQPYYVLLNTHGSSLVPPQGYNTSITNYLEFLESGLKSFKK